MINLSTRAKTGSQKHGKRHQHVYTQAHKKQTRHPHGHTQVHKQTKTTSPPRLRKQLLPDEVNYDFVHGIGSHYHK